MNDKRKRFAYNAAFKLKVVSYAESTNNSAAACEFSVNESMVSKWRKAKPTLEELPKTKKARRGSETPFKPLEDILFQWIGELRQSACIVTRMMIRQRALYVYRTRKDLDLPKSFKASGNWCSRFLRRHNLALRQKTHIAQKLPAEVETKVVFFHQFVIRERKKIEYDSSQIGNMDETPLNFDMPGSRTIDTKGTSTVSVRTCGAEKQHFTVVLTCMADGTKLDPMLIFKQKTMPKDKFPSGVYVTVQDKGWMGESLVLKWLENVWMKRPGAARGCKSLLVWDMFRAHLCEAVKKKLVDTKTRQAVIPGGCTSLLQPLDVCLNKPFKANVRSAWNTWMVNGDHTYTKTNKQRKAPLPVVAEWIKTAWLEIPVDMVKRSFLKCGIANALDGSEDDCLYDDLVSTESRRSDTTESVADIPDDFEDELNDYYDDKTDSTAWDILCTEESDSEFDWFTEADL